MIRILIFTTLLLFAGKSPEYSKPDKGLKNQRPELVIGLMADIQYCDCDSSGTRFYSNSLEKLEQAINEFNKHSLDFVVSLGDLIDRDYSSYNKVLPIINSSNAKVKHVIGNHDNEVAEEYKDSVFLRLKTVKGYYSFSQKGYRFIVLNSFDLNTKSLNTEKRLEAKYLIKNINDQNGINGHQWNGGVGKKQKLWFIDELVDAADSNQKVVIFSHHPVWPQSSLNILNYLEMLEVINNFNNIICWFAGHKHEGGYGNINKTHFVNMRGMVETKTENAFAIVEFYPNKILIKGYGREKSQVLEY
ncbi:MAG: metallophosphoesterase [Bacteroidales bacterium]|nr:metallophosphoesterase [Bacteroidales bacterium]